MARVLIIDDDVTLRQALTKHLERAGHEVRQAADGDAGIRANERHAADVVIVDIFMPGQGGLQTIGRLRREWPAVKIVAMSGVKSAGAIDVEGHAVAIWQPGTDPAAVAGSLPIRRPRCRPLLSRSLCVCLPLQAAYACHRPLP